LEGSPKEEPVEREEAEQTLDSLMLRPESFYAFYGSISILPKLSAESEASSKRGWRILAEAVPRQKSKPDASQDRALRVRNTIVPSNLPWILCTVDPRRGHYLFSQF